MVWNVLERVKGEFIVCFSVIREFFANVFKSSFIFEIDRYVVYYEINKYLYV